MKVLMVAPGYVIHAQRPLHWLLEKGCNVTFVDWANSNPMTENRDNYKYLQFPSPRGSRFYGIIGKKVANWTAFWTEVYQLWFLKKKINPDITHIHWVDHHAFKCVKARMSPLILSVWGSDINQLFFRDIDGEKRRLIGQTLAAADTVIVDAVDIIERCNILAGCEIRAKLLPIGIDMGLFRSGYARAALKWRRKLKIPSDSRVLLSPRSWERIYRHEFILEAFAKALSRLKTSTYLVFKKTDMRDNHDFVIYEKELIQRAYELGINKQVKLIPWVPYEQLPEVYGFADMIINYPSEDAFPMTFIEASACEKPVISCRLPAYMDTFAEKYFRMVKPGNINELSDAIVEELNGNVTGNTKNMIKARRVVEKKYDEKIYIQGLLNIYTSLI